MSRRIRNSEKTALWKIDEIRSLYLDGMAVCSIAVKIGVSGDTVRRHCKDLERPVKKPLETAEIRDYLEGWK